MVQPPVQPSIDIVAGTSNGATVEVVITFTNPLGESLPSPAADAALTVTDQALLESPLGRTPKHRPGYATSTLGRLGVRITSRMDRLPSRSGQVI